MFKLVALLTLLTVLYCYWQDDWIPATKCGGKSLVCVVKCYITLGFMFS